MASVSVETLPVDPLELDEVEPWRRDAACREADDPSIFFPRRGEPTDLAVAYCDRCPVDEECREFARRRGLKFGIWGGESANGRRRIREGFREPVDGARRAS